SFAHMHAASYATHLIHHQEAELAYIWDDNEQRGKEMAETFSCTFIADLDEFLKTDIEAVVICSENANHKEHVIKSARAKKQILCEKPIATEIDDAKEMIKVCEEEGVALQIAY